MKQKLSQLPFPALAGVVKEKMQAETVPRTVSDFRDAKSAEPALPSAH